MNKAMSLAIRVAYKAANETSLTIRTNEYVVDGANIDSFTINTTISPRQNTNIITINIINDSFINYIFTFTFINYNSKTFIIKSLISYKNS